MHTGSLTEFGGYGPKQLGTESATPIQLLCSARMAGFAEWDAAMLEEFASRATIAAEKNGWKLIKVVSGQGDVTEALAGVHVLDEALDPLDYAMILEFANPTHPVRSHRLLVPWCDVPLVRPLPKPNLSDRPARARPLAVDYAKLHSHEPALAVFTPRVRKDDLPR
jgi:hypothetical protein